MSQDYPRVEHTDPFSENPAMPLNNPAHDFSTAQQGYSSMDAPYGNQAFSSSGWLEKEEAKKRRSKWLVSPPRSPAYPPQTLT